MDKEVPTKQKTLILKLILLFVAFLFFRFFFGDNLIELFSVAQYRVFGSSQTGQTLDPLVANTVASASDSKSRLLNDINSFALDGATGIKTSDPRILAMKKFLIDYNSPMYPYSETFISEASKYGLDWRLVVSISGVESAFGNLIPYGSNNGWGWRGGPGGAYSIFKNWNEAIKTVTRGLAQGYGTNLTPFQIERRYCPPCYANPYHAWANGVTKFMNELDYYYLNLEKL